MFKLGSNRDTAAQRMSNSRRGSASAKAYDSKVSPDHNVLDLIQEVLQQDHTQESLQREALWWCPKTKFKDSLKESGFRGVSRNGNTGW